MFLIREAAAEDLDGLFDVAAYLDSVNLPHDRARLREIIAASAASFAGQCDVADRRFVFVLTEAGGLVVHPDRRIDPGQLGKLLFHVRFLYIALHRALFRDDVLSELMPPLQPDGTSLLWEALGRKFTGLSYQEADRLSHENKEFIRALFPEEPIYATLLPAEVQTLIGEVGPQTKGVEKMLRRAGFHYAHRIDPFDGGPHFQARLDDVLPVRATRRVRVADEGAAAFPGRLLIVPDDGDLPVPRSFRAVAVPAAVDGGVVSLPASARAALGVEVGGTVAVLPLDPPV